MAEFNLALNPSNEPPHILSKGFSYRFPGEILTDIIQARFEAVTSKATVRVNEPYTHEDQKDVYDGRIIYPVYPHYEYPHLFQHEA